MKNMTLSAIAEAIGGKLHTGKNVDLQAEATGVVVDSRLITPGGIFVATKGAKVDGHDFIDQVMAAGALGVICEKEPQNEDYSYILVEDSFAALKAVAAYYRNQLDIKIVGIIGSVGKTSTKEIVASVLETKYSVLKTQGNFNNEIGVPLTLLRIREEHEIAVVEMGISDFGEMSRLGAIARPDYVIMTNIGPCHLENLKDLPGVLKAKSEVFDYMNEDGVIFLYAQDEMLKSVSDTKNRKIVYYDDAFIYADKIKSLGLKGSEFELNANGKSAPARINLPGMHMVVNSLAATAIGLELGISLDEISKGLDNATGLAGRSNLIDTGEYLILDDCYNANPKSMKSAIDLLKYALGRKVAILGDMFELGEKECELHGEVGKYAVENPVDVLVCVGKLSKNMYDYATEANAGNCEIIYFENKEDLLEVLKDSGRSFIKSDDTILIKASHGMGFTEIVELLS